MIAAPVKQFNHKYIGSAVSEWLDIHFGDQSFNGRVFIGHRKHGGGVYTMTARSLNELYPYIMMIHVSKKLDYYITANTVSGVNRNIDGLFGLQNIVIDIDCHIDDSDTVELEQGFLWRADRDLWSDGTLPYPNSIVRTGRGIQLWWAIKPCHASCRYYYDQIKTGMMDHFDALLSEYSELGGLEVDRGASSNPVGYFRLPCTYNTKAGRYGSLQVLHSDRYDTHDLSGYILPFPAEKCQRHSEKAVSMERGDIILLHNNYSVGANRLVQLIKLRNLRNNEIGAEQRNNFCFAVYNTLRMAFDHDEAMDRLMVFNTGFKEPMSEREILHTICSAERKGGYKYSNVKLIELLAITEEEQDMIGLHPFRGKYRPWNYAKPNTTRDSVRKARKEGRDAKIIELHKKGVSQAETARQLGISRNTVSSVIKAKDDLETAQDNLLKNGSIYDCFLVEPGGQDNSVSSLDGQSLPPIRVLFSLLESLSFYTWPPDDSC